MPASARVRVIAALVACLLACPASASRDWLPCNLVTPSGSGIFRYTAGGDAIQAEDSIVRTEYGWHVEFRYAVADFDRFEGTAVENIRVRATGLGISAAAGERWLIGAFVPHFDVSSSAFEASGIGDVTVQAICRFNREDDVQWWDLLVGATLPTGDEDDRLGYGDATARLGVAWNYGEDGTRKALRPKWQFSVGANYGHHLGNSDLSTLGTFAGVRGSVGPSGSTAFVYSVTAATEWELADQAEPWPGAVRDDRHQTDLLVGLGLTTPRDAFQLVLTARVALDDDGLRDELIPGINGIFRFGKN